MSERIARTALACVALACLCACSERAGVPPSTAELELMGQRAQHGGQVTATETLKYWAGKGVVVAQRELALVDASSPRKHDDARLWLARAGAAGDALAAYHLGDAYYYGKIGMHSDARQAWHWFGVAARAGNTKAAVMLSRMARGGEGGSKDATAATGWLKFASERGDAQAMLLLASAYAAGDGVERDERLASLWLGRAGNTPGSVMAAGNDEQRPSPDSTRPRRMARDTMLSWNTY